MPGHSAMGGHQSARPMTTTWLTPPHVIDALGGAESFDLDPCTIAGSPIPTARASYCLPADGLALAWDGRVWINPPYTTGEVDGWLSKLGDHGRGAALIFARTETECFHKQVWRRASGLLFLHGRLHFHYPEIAALDRCGAGHTWARREADNPKNRAEWCCVCGVAKANAGAPSVICAYGQRDLDRLAACDLAGALVPLRFSRGVMVLALAGAADASSESWREAVLAQLQRAGGGASVSDLYRALARHPKTAANPHWRAKVRQTLQRGPFKREGRGSWSIAA